MRHRSLAGVGLLTSLGLVFAALQGLAPEATAGPASTGLSIAWAPGTPTPLPLGDQAAFDVTMTSPDVVPPGDVTIRLQLANGQVGALPGQCLTTGVTPPSGLSPDGARVTCTLGQLAPQQQVSVRFAVQPGGATDLLAIQVDDYDNQGTVLSRAVAAAAPAATYRLLSSPDFLNADVADLRRSRWASWGPGQPNSWNASYRQALNKVMKDWQSFRPNAVTVPGDLVNGRWMKDPDRVGAFGPVDTRKHRRASIRRAARTYFTAWKQRFAAQGLRVYPGVGDHDLGDNPWAGNKILDEKREDAPLFRKLFAEFFTKTKGGSYRYSDRPRGSTWEGTAYAVRPNPEVQLVMLDVFRTITGDTIPQVTGGQLRWLEKVLKRAQTDGVDWIVVEGHTPILGPVRRGPSSGLMYKGGGRSKLWSLFKKYGVDVYLCGEVHASTAIARDGIVQVSHGGNFGYGHGASSRGGTSFLVSDFSSGGLAMRLYSWNRARSGDVLWQMAGNRIPEFQHFVGPPVQIGSISLTNNGASADNRNIVTERSGLLTLFDPADEPGSFSPEWLPGR
jgi:hypothetical protein